MSGVRILYVINMWVETCDVIHCHNLFLKKEKIQSIVLGVDMKAGQYMKTIT